jgi:pyruvate dehydrogenase E1 component alpha subunit
MKTLNKEELINFEEKISNLYKKVQIRAPVHLSRGNEDQILSIFEEVDEGDWVFSNWRSHYHALLKGIPPEQVEKEIVEGRSMHISSNKNKFFSSSLVGGTLPIALGVSMALKRKNSKNKVWAFCGDMTAETGVFHEVTKYAIGHDLPINFIVEDDGLSVYTPTKLVWGASAFLDEGENSVRGYGPIKSPGNSKIRRYEYQRQWPHHGIGLWVDFPEDKKVELEGIVKSGPKYENELKKAMNSLSIDEKVIFLGQTVGYKGSPIYSSLEDISMERRIELPIMEEVQMGISMGFALEGYVPVSIFPRFDFLTLATNQLVNHLDKAYELSHGQFNPKVIIRTKVGSKEPLYPGPQHCQDHTEAYRRMLTNIDVVRLEHSGMIMPEYKNALENNRSTLIIED